MTLATSLDTPSTSPFPTPLNTARGTMKQSNAPKTYTKDTVSAVSREEKHSSTSVEMNEDSSSSDKPSSKSKNSTH